MKRRCSVRSGFAVVLFGCGLILGSCAAGTYTGKCVGIFDGDTLLVLKAGKTVKIRLEGIDCPERDQALGKQARQYASSLAFGKIVQVRECYKDAFGRSVARVSVAGRDLSLELIRKGLAWHFTRYSSEAELSSAEKEAKRAKIGLWAEPDPTPPWKFRRMRDKNKKD
ncbi:MAG: thermonuclease family protein [Candidatus Aminicenantales bacterium]